MAPASFEASLPKAPLKGLPVDEGRDDVEANTSTSRRLQNWEAHRGRRLRLFRSRKRVELSYGVQTLAAIPIWEKFRFASEEPLYNTSQAPFGWPQCWSWHAPAESLAAQESSDERHRRLYQWRRHRSDEVPALAPGETVSGPATLTKSTAGGRWERILGLRDRNHNRSSRLGEKHARSLARGH
ncbi:uncharacterized protein [Dermacentor albipictus]|uniref:uncharacterized protein n=1 Tax=Dermacentor albipictus TaxID=60249 RepID=UPI0031FE3184